MPETSPRPQKSKVEQMFYGIAKAPKAWSEFQGKQFLKLYDKYYVEKQSPENKKLLKKVRPIIEKRAKTLGWIATGVEVAVVAGAALWGFKKLKAGKSFIPPEIDTNPLLSAPIVENRAQQLSPKISTNVDNYELLKKDRERYKMIKDTLLPIEAADGLARKQAQIDRLMDQMKENHNLLDKDLRSTLARAWVGFDQPQEVSTEQINELAFLAEFLQWGPRDPELIDKLRKNLPDQFAVIFQRQYDPKEALGFAQIAFELFHHGRDFQQDRPDMQKTFGLWGTLRFAALDFLLNNRGTDTVHGDQRMGMLTDAWKEHGWSVE